MKVRISKRHGLIGLYWSRDDKELAVNLTRRFGIRLQFKVNQRELMAQLRHLNDTLVQQKRLEELTDCELVRVVHFTLAAEEECVTEMMRRLCPNWYHAEPETNG